MSSYFSRVAHTIGPRLEAGLRTALPFLFLSYAVPLVSFFVFAIPPFQNPDEPNHFLRTAQIAGGELIGIRFDDRSSGGHVEQSAIRVVHGFDHIPVHERVKVTASDFARVRGETWGGGVVAESFANTSVYPPPAYLPVIIGVMLGKAFDLTVLDTFYVARLCNAFTALLVAAFAIHLCRQGRCMLFTALLLPMTLSLFASVSQDALVIVLAALLFAVVGRIVEESREATLRESLILFAIIFVLATARPPYVFLALLLSWKPRGRSVQERGGVWLQRMALMGAAFVLVALWLAFVTAYVAVPLRPGIASTREQLAHLARDPSAIFAIADMTCRRQCALYARSLIGYLGWLDTLFPMHYYLSALGVIATSWLADRMAAARSDLMFQGVLGPSLVLSMIGIFASLYLTWTPVGHSFIQGVQGRYFIPLLPFFALLGPALAVRGAPIAVARSVVLLFPLLTLAYAPIVVIGRYYLSE